MIPMALEANISDRGLSAPVALLPRSGRRVIALNRRSCHAKVHKDFNAERHLVDRQAYEHRCSTALAEWQSLAGLS